MRTHKLTRAVTLPPEVQSHYWVAQGTGVWDSGLFGPACGWGGIRSFIPGSVVPGAGRTLPRMTVIVDPLAPRCPRCCLVAAAA